jgi:hypothetical protein
MRRRTLLASSLCVAIAGRNHLDRRHDPERMLDSGDGSIQDIAAADRINPSYLARVLRLTLLAPDITQAILDGQHDPERITLARLMRPSPAVWGAQEHAFSRQPSRSIV